MYRAVVKLHTLTDADRPGTQHNDLALVRHRNFILLRAEGRVIVRRCGFKFSSAGIDHLIAGHYAHALARGADFIHALAGDFGDGHIGKAHILRREHQARRQGFAAQLIFHLRDVVDFIDEPLIHFRDGVNLVHRGNAAAQGFGNHEDALVVDAVEVLLDSCIIPGGHFRHGQAVYADFQRTHSLENSAFKVAVNAHDLARGLHLRAQRLICVDELVKRPAREFYYTVVKRRLKAGLGLLRYGVGDFIKRIADGNLGRNLGNRIPRCLGGQCRGTAYTRIYFDNIVAVAVGVEGILRVAAAFDAEFADNAQGSASEHLILMVGQRLRRCNDDGVARMHAHGVEVFHIADGDAVVVAVTHDFVFDFLPAGHTALDKHLTNQGVIQALDDDINEFFLILGNAAARAAHGVSRAHDNRIANAVRKFHSTGHIFHNGAFRDRLTEFFHRFLKEFPVFGLLDGRQRRSQEFYAVFLEYTALCQLYSQIESCLTAQSCQKAVRFFLGDDFGQKFRRQRLDIHAVSNMRIRHDGCRIGVYQHHFESFFFEGAAGLRTGIVKFGCLTDDDGARANNHYFFEIFLLWHLILPSTWSKIRQTDRGCRPGPARLPDDTARRTAAAPYGAYLPPCHR